MSGRFVQEAILEFGNAFPLCRPPARRTGAWIQKDTSGLLPPRIGSLLPTGPDSRFGRDELFSYMNGAGELYLVNRGGTIQRIIPAP